MLSSTSLGDTIILNAGTTYTGMFTLPNKGAGSNFITIQSSQLASLPATGTRVNLTHAGNMPKVVSPSQNVSAIAAATSAHHFKLIGLEIIGFQNGTQDSSVDLVQLGTSGSAQDTLTEVPGNFVIDRCIIRAASTTNRIKRGIALNSSSTDVTNCYIMGFKLPGSDAQAISGWNGPGPFNIINNYLEGSGENVMFGGATPTVPNLVPSDIVIQKNHFHKPIEWNQHQPGTYGGIDYSIKNLFELKNARRVTVDGNIFENNWSDAQSGWGIVFTPATGLGVAPWTTVEDVLFQNNIFRHSCNGFNILGSDQDAGEVSANTKRITIKNNLCYDIGGSQWGTSTGKWIQLIVGAAGGSPVRTIDDLHVLHNTAFFTANIVTTQGTGNPGFRFNDNVVTRSGSGVIGSGFGEGNATLNGVFVSAQFANNVLQAGTASRYNQYPNNLFPALWTGVLVNQADPTPETTNYANYKVVVGSPYDNTATDGTDRGCNIDTLVAATAGCISGVWSTPAPLAYDGFNYTGGLVGDNGGTGFSGAWASVSGQGDPSTAAGSLTYTSGSDTLVTTGNKLQPAVTCQAVRNFASPITASGVKWVSFRINRTVTPLSTNHVGFPLYPQVSGGGTSIFLGKPGSASNWGVDIGGSVSTATAALQANAFLVYKLDWSVVPGSVRVSMWVNPSLTSEGALGASHMTPLTVVHSSNLLSMKMSTGANSSSYQLDEFRIGDSFAAVTPK